MANALFERGREGFLDGSLDWDTQTFSAALIDGQTGTAGNILISSSTNATPIVVTTATHNLSNGDLVSIKDHATNTCANGIFKVAGVTGTTFQLTNPVDGTNVVGNGVGGATGVVTVLGGVSTVGKFYSDFVGGLVGAKVNLTSPTVTDGVADAADTTFTSVSGNAVKYVMIFQDTGTNSTSRMVAMIDGTSIVTCNTTLSAGTALLVEPTQVNIASAVVLPFSTGQTATLNGASTAPSRSITVNSTTVTVGGRAQAPATGSGLPVTPNGGNIIVSWDNGVNKIFKL